jgi:hypothetical protein
VPEAGFADEHMAAARKSIGVSIASSE